MHRLYDIIIIGTGAMGSAAIYQLSKKNLKVAGIDQYHPPHGLGSSHGETRITRQAVGESEKYIPLVRESNKIWTELEQKTGQELFRQCGGYLIGNKNSEMLFHGTKDFIAHQVQLAKRHGIKHALKSSPEISKEIPALQLSPDDIGFYEPEAGVLFPEKIIAAFLMLAQKNNAELFFREKVIGYRFENKVIVIKTNRREFISKKIIFTAGPWIKDFLPAVFKNKVKVYKQEMFWFKAEAEKTIGADAFPWVIWVGKTLADFRTFFPAPEGGTSALKFMTEQYVDEVHPDTVDRKISVERVAAVYEKFIKNKITGITDVCLKKEVCFYTVTENAHFMIDYHPEHKSVLFASPCSGHGFKHSAAIGKLLAQNILGAGDFFDWEIR